MSDTTPPSSASSSSAPPRSRGRRALRGLLWSLFGLLALLGVLLAGAWWWIGSDHALALAAAEAARDRPAGQQLTHDNVEGSLLAGGRIGRLRWQSPTLAVEVRDARIGWHLPALPERRLTLGEVHMARLDIEPIGPQPENSPPPEPLQQLVLPLAIELPFKVDVLRWAGPPEVVASDLAGSYRYEAGAHRLLVDGVDLAEGHYAAQAQLQGAAPMALHVKLDGQVKAPLDAQRSLDV